jgi:NADPH:quinone reductase
VTHGRFSSLADRRRSTRHGRSSGRSTRPGRPSPSIAQLNPAALPSISPADSSATWPARLAYPGDIKKRQDAFGYGMPYPRVIPHSDGAGVVDRVGKAVSTSLIGRRVWCYAAQTYRPFGTAAEYTVVPAAQAVPLPDAVSF